MELVLYGSETGNSADLAELLVDRLRRLNMSPVLLPFGEATTSLVQGAAHIFIICSTTGQGALPINTKPFWQTLLRKSQLPVFTGIKFATFGLGDSSYPRYNWAIKKIHSRVLQLGGEVFVERGEADEQSPDGVEYVFQQWLQTIVEKFNLPMIPLTELLPARYKVEILQDKLKSTSARTRDLPVAKVVENKRLTAADHFQDVRHLKLSPEDEQINYEPGDVVTLYPANRKEHVDALIEDQGWKDIADYQISVDEKWERLAGNKLVKPLTLRSLLTWHLDLNGIPRRSFFAIASHFAEGRESERMAEFGSGEEDALQDLYDYANRPRRSLIETILEFETLKIPLEYLLDVLPVLRPRQFSIASPKDSPELELTVALVRYKTILHRIRRGLCTNWLQHLHPGETISYTIENTNTRLLQLADFVSAVIFVCTGTGIAPVRSFIQSYKGTTPIYLFFGCRYNDKDFLYKDEWPTTNARVYCAFSREGGSYVQQQLELHSRLLRPLLPSSLVFVCGAAGAMPVGVRTAFCDIAGEETVALMEKKGLYLQETY